ncbi:MAG: hypothetical protein A3I89_02085 [Candidatus Harrisonbacteria bacterium RIFCSPLOWO2_02_FULL_41_11]|uniref:Cupin 2 conserved barrel domain-containing protein n=1 Tax=Candidatus Harrisonbacteria bacterium RIFCSPHIGHO2_02_FULL_42_16 TaxID=1798404 RepID=A0A1G1ZHB8_9BACT|nr:MAG: hypothetical protein A3B92_01685 [Candidatus Harrisonbacteria bacterium RIFCSPHIGHO2_02_FULL_42_16]OGY65648.1 MAG: hypothetical protein A3I89_02085 [Candidatus Harrisonbacteria bacterium RIFCSPLOWO2_02_FULL_41_11]
MKVVRKEEINKFLEREPVVGKKMLEPLRTLVLAKELPFGIVEDFEVKESEAEVHKHEGDLWLCLEGEVEFTCGGELVESWIRDGSNGNELGGKDIKNGQKVVLKSGDWLWIPPGEPHLHRAKLARMVVVKVPNWS